MRRTSLKITILATLVLGSLSLGSIAQAQEPDTARVGEDIVLQCSEIFGPGSPGTVVFTPSGMFNANCNPYAPSPSEVGGAIVAKCADIFGEGVSGNIVWQPTVISRVTAADASTPPGSFRWRRSTRGRD